MTQEKFALTKEWDVLHMCANSNRALLEHNVKTE
jgi:hypothetical protein